MSNPIKILAFAGSARKASFNKNLVQIALEGAKAAGAVTTFVDLKDYPMPLYNGDLEAENGLPDTVQQFKDLLKGHQGFLLSCPEYNGSITPLLKNAIDWASRPQDGEPPLTCFKGKVTALLATSPGGLGGLRGLVHVRAILEGIGTIVIPDQKTIPNAHEAFTKLGQLVDQKQMVSVRGIGEKLMEITTKLNT
jgi:NAD(P)H-dependent FMN reductase